MADYFRLLFCLQVWGKPLWSRKPVKRWCHQESRLEVFTRRRCGRAAGESALMLSPSPERGAACPESGTARPVSIAPSASFHPGVLTRSALPRRDGAGVSRHGGREHTVGQYVVDLPSFEHLALPLFRNVRHFTPYCPPYLQIIRPLIFLSFEGIIGSLPTYIPQ